MSHLASLFGALNIETKSSNMAANMLPLGLHAAPICASRDLDFKATVPSLSNGRAKPAPQKVTCLFDPRPDSVDSGLVLVVCYGGALARTHLPLKTSFHLQRQQSEGRRRKRWLSYCRNRSWSPNSKRLHRVIRATFGQRDWRCTRKPERFSFSTATTSVLR